MADRKQEFSKFLREERTKIGVSQNKLAVLSGLLQPSFSRIESGRVFPRYDTVLKISQGFKQLGEESAGERLCNKWLDLTG